MGEHYGKIIAVNKETGSVKWIRFRPGMVASCDPTLDRDGNVFVHDDNGYLMSLKPDGGENWILGAGYSKYYPGDAKTINDANTERWMKDVGLSRREYKYDDGDNYCVGTQQILVGDDQKVAFGMRDGRMMVLNHDTGRVEMFFDTGDAIYSAPIATKDGKIIVANTKGHVFCLDTNTTVDGKYGKEMKLLWDKELDEYASPQMVDSSGRVYVSSSKRGLIVYNPDGSQDWAAAVSPRGGVVEGKDGSVTVCDLHSVVTLQPLRERIKSLNLDEVSPESGAEAANQLSIEDEGASVNVGGVVLKKKD
jgi:outer membrane protein assembly factor BamB